MKKELFKWLIEFTFTSTKMKKTPKELTEMLVKFSEVKMIENGTREKFSPKFLEKENACVIEEILTDIALKTYTHEEVLFLLKIENDKKEMNYFILRHFKSRKPDYYFAINIMPKEEFKEKKVLKNAVFFYKKK
ncbi:MAG: hypothetical protein QG630_342 [Patescibacteria group bacterium]|nr:hypothetical protein [Patescibacteria group bacterium]